MNDRLRAELERLKERQAQLYHAVDLLGVHIKAMEKRIAEEEQAEGGKGETFNIQHSTSNVERSPEPVIQSATFNQQAAADTGRESQVNRQKGKPALQSAVAPTAVPPVLEEVERGRGETFNVQGPPEPVKQPEAFNPQPATAAQAAMPPPLLGAVEGGKGETFNIQHSTPNVQRTVERPESFEMRLGTYWLVRIGIVAMLTALVFFGTYAYQNYIGKIGPAGKVTLLYLASGVLLGFGAWFQRKAAKESLRNYAQVLFAGGMAAVYFTTYAAHHFPNLRVIENALLDGALLFGWAGLMAWTADRKKSEVFAMFAVGLAYYTSVITHVGHFTLYSNLLLAAAALFFLVRNRWAKLSFASLAATYASYGFWRFYTQESGWQWAGAEPLAGLWTGIYFLAAYWAVFTAAVFLSQHKEFAGVNRASFITLNNAAFYVLFLLTMWQVHSGGFWRFNVITGVVLLGAAAFARIRLRDEPLAANTYLTQGLLLVTVGIVAKFSGQQLALVLALESVTLWMLGSLRKNIIMRTGACVSAAMATIGAFDSIERYDSSGAWLGAGVGALMAFNAFWAHWREQRNNPRLMRATPTYFSALALLVWAFAIGRNVAEVNNAAAYALLALVLAGSVHLTKLRELSLLGQLLLPFGAIQFFANQAGNVRPEPWWVFLCVAGVALALVHWWQKQTVVAAPRALRLAGQSVAALVLVWVTTLWLAPKLDLAQWVLVNSALVLVLTGYGAVMRNGVLALAAQIFAGIAVANFALHAGQEITLAWQPALAPLGALTLLALGGRYWAEWRAKLLIEQTETHERDARAATWVRSIAVWYGRAAMALVVWWTFAYVPERELIWSFAALGAAAFGIAGGRRSRDFLVLSTVLNVCSFGCLALALVKNTAVYWPNFAAVLAWMAQQQIARRSGERFEIPAVAHNIVIVGAGLALWLLVSRWVMRDASGFFLTASWSAVAFAVFALGMALRERMYRWVGLGVLGAALGRVVLVDVWKLETLYRIVSFFALGLVLLVLGFIYNKYQERLRQWL